MHALDGNAIAGDLFTAFGRDMTTSTGVCATCGLTSVMAELRVYTRSPGVVARCPGCGSVVLVLVEVHGQMLVHVPAFELTES
jgi:hypothetical protein